MSGSRISRSRARRVASQPGRHRIARHRSEHATVRRPGRATPPRNTAGSLLQAPPLPFERPLVRPGRRRVFPRWSLAQLPPRVNIGDGWIHRVYRSALPVGADRADRRSPMRRRSQSRAPRSRGSSTAPPRGRRRSGAPGGAGAAIVEVGAAQALVKCRMISGSFTTRRTNCWTAPLSMSQEFRCEVTTLKPCPSGGVRRGARGATDHSAGGGLDGLAR